MFAAAAAIVRQFAAIDVWINDAMVTVFSPVSDITPAEFRRVTEVTYLGAVHGTMAALQHMCPRNRGTIVQVGSALTYRGIPLQAAYCGAKHAIRGFTDSLRTELLHSNSRIKLTIVELPAVNTPQFDWARTHMAHQPRPVAPVVQPEPIADAIFSASLHPTSEPVIPATSLFHIAIKTGKPEATKRFYEQVFGMAESPRPPFEFPGYWMQLYTPYGGPLAHLYRLGGLRQRRAHTDGQRAIDHIALSAYGFGETRERCRSLGIPYRERSMPGFPRLATLLLRSQRHPVELNFHSAYEERQGVAVDPNNFLKAGLEWFDPEAYRQFETT